MEEEIWEAQERRLNGIQVKGEEIHWDDDIAIYNRKMR
jgi:hypothetical protein